MAATQASKPRSLFGGVRLDKIKGNEHRPQAVTALISPSRSTKPTPGGTVCARAPMHAGGLFLGRRAGIDTIVSLKWA